MFKRWMTIKLGSRIEGEKNISSLCFPGHANPMLSFNSPPKKKKKKQTRSFKIVTFVFSKNHI